MIRPIRGKLLLGIAFVLFSLGVSGGILFWSNDLPDPAEANRRQLLCWLVDQDLRRQPPAICDSLARRLEEEFGSHVDWSEIDDFLTAEQRLQLRSNLPLVLRFWLLKKAEAFAQIQVQKRTAFLDEMLDLLSHWKGIESLLPPAKGEKPNSQDLLAMLCAEVERIEREVEKPRAARVKTFCTALQIRWVLRKFLGNESSYGIREVD